MANIGIALGAGVQQRNVLAGQRIQSRQVNLGEQRFQFQQQQAQVAQTNEITQQALQNVSDISDVVRIGIGGLLSETGGPEAQALIDEHFRTVLQGADRLEEGGNIDGANQVRSAAQQQMRALLLHPTAVGAAQVAGVADVARTGAIASGLGVPVSQVAQARNQIPTPRAGGGNSETLSAEESGVLGFTSGVVVQRNLQTGELTAINPPSGARVREPARVITIGPDNRDSLLEEGLNFSGLPDGTVIELLDDNTFDVKHVPEIPRSAMLSSDGTASAVAVQNIFLTTAGFVGARMRSDGTFSYGRNSEENQIKAALMTSEAIRMIEAGEAFNTAQASEAARRRVNNAEDLPLDSNGRPNRALLRGGIFYKVEDRNTGVIRVRRWNADAIAPDGSQGGFEN